MKNLWRWFTEEIECFWIRHFGPSLREIFEKHQGRLIYKWDHYLEVYDRHFSQFRGQAVVIVEVGVFHGGSLELWRKYFGPRAVIHGVDVDRRCVDFTSKNTYVCLGDQGSPEFWTRFKLTVPHVDIFIDDGGHFMQQQIVTHQAMYPHLAEGGVFICEDLHTSYWEDYDGGHQKKGSFIEYCKNLIDQLNAWHSREEKFQVDDFTESTPGIFFYDSMVVFEKKKRRPPSTLKRGKPSFPE